MKPELLRLKLIAAARRAGVADRVPYAFEKRVMARLFGRPVLDPWSAWGALLWRALAASCGVMLLAGLGTVFLRPPADDLGTQLDAVLLAGLDSGAETP